MSEKWIEYPCNGQSFKGYLAYDEEDISPRPAVIVAHAWKGQDDFAREKAQYLAQLGYIGFAADLYGDGTCVSTNDEAASMMSPLFIDRKTLRDRIIAAYQTLIAQKMVDNSLVGAIGFCFGGLTVIELLRTGVKLKGVVSFHGLLGDSLGEMKAETVAPANELHGSLLILHGYKDPLVSQEDIINIQKEFTEANLDWQMHTYGTASHAFTNPIANEPDSGLLYDPIAEKRSLLTMKNFFNEVF